MTRDMHHDVIVRQEPTPEPEGNGVNAILRAFIRNPVAAAEIIMFIGGAFGVYYALNKGIDDAKATSEQHYRDLTAQFTQYTKDATIQVAGIGEKLNSRIDVLAASDAAEVADIKALYVRGDTRYREILDKLSSHDTSFAKMQIGVEYIVRQLDEGRTSFTPHDKRGEIGPRPSYAGGDK